MIFFEQFKQAMSFDTQGRFCIEILFSVNDNEKYHTCWMGKQPDQKTKTDIFWFALTSDGKDAYDFSSFDEMVSAKLFDGKSFVDVWKDITFLEVDGCEPINRLAWYAEVSK